MLLVFSKTILKISFIKHEQNIPLEPVCLLFFNVVFYSKNKKNKENKKKFWFPFFFSEKHKNTKKINTKFKEQIKVFRKHNFNIICVCKNCSQ